MDRIGSNISQDNSEEILTNLRLLEHNMDRINQLWAIEDTQIRCNKPIIGHIMVFFKRAIRKSIYWFIKPYWRQQTEFNSATACAIADIYRILSNSKMEQPIGIINNLGIFEEDEKPRIIQLVSSLNFGDAVGNDVIAFKNALLEAGFNTEIYADNIHKKIKPGTARFFRDLPIEKVNANDILIYHFSSECHMNETVKKLPCKKILRYHNITPPEFFKGYDALAEKATRIGLKQVKELAQYMDYCLPVSEFNRNDLEKMGYQCPMRVLPIIIQFEDYRQQPNEKVILNYKDGKTNLVFVGRMAPNKKVEDIIAAFKEYKDIYNKDARLFLVGSFSEQDRYYNELISYIIKNKVKDVVFPGHIAFDEILAYYSIADAFICMSEHEGFCVPLVEAMFFKTPIIAFDSSAISSTLGGSGVLLSQKQPQFVAEAIDSIIRNPEKREDLIEKQLSRLKNFDNSVIKEELIRYLREILDKKIEQ